MSNLRKFDVLVTGAGLQSIQAARTYVEIHPNANLAILEGGECIRGAWSKDRVYDTLWSQDGVTFAEFSERTLEVKPEELFHGLFSAPSMTRYIENYARSHNYAGSTLEDCIMFSTRVMAVRKVDNLWRVDLEGSLQSLEAAKLIDASGITNVPELPNIPKLSTFKGIQMHMKDLAKSDPYNDLMSNRVAVIGGGKSGADAAYSATKANKTPSPPFKCADEPLLTRILFNVISSHFVKDTFFVRLLNRTAIGRYVIRFLWRNIEGDFRKRANYNRPDPTGNGFKNLEPDTPLFWANDNTGVGQREDFIETIAENVKIFREDITEMEPDSIVLADGTKVAIDTLLYATGWRRHPGHYDVRTAAELGLPVPLGPAASVEREKWTELDAAPDETVLKRFPILANPPPHFKKEPQVTPYRLYRSIAPVHDSSIVFLGRMSIINGWRLADIQSLWAVGALDGRIHNQQSAAERQRDVAETVMWSRRRYLNKGKLANWMLWGCVAYTDRLLEDLGLTSHLGKEGLLTPCRAKTLNGLIEEYRGKYGGGGDMTFPFAFKMRLYYSRLPR